VTAALDALARLDDGTPLPGDAALAAVFERHCQWEAFVPPEPLCRHGNTADCNPCFLDWDDLMRRVEDQ
jgi:hypothetical protein